MGPAKTDRNKAETALYRKGLKDGVRYYQRDLQVAPNDNRMCDLVSDLIGIWGPSDNIHENDPWLQGYIKSAMEQQ